VAPLIPNCAAGEFQDKAAGLPPQLQQHLLTPSFSQCIYISIVGSNSCARWHEFLSRFEPGLKGRWNPGKTFGWRPSLQKSWFWLCVLLLPDPFAAPCAPQVHVVPRQVRLQTIRQTHATGFRRNCRITCTNR